MILRCTQCAMPKPDNGWKICGDCANKNVAYEKECATMAMAFHREFQKNPPGSPLGWEFRLPSEMRGRKARPAVLAPYLRDDRDDA